METKHSSTEITLPIVRQLITANNPNARVDDVELYAHQFMTYCEAAMSIMKNGTICAHPRTGQPMENPYVKVRTGAMNAMQKSSRLLNLNPLWEQARRFLESLEFEDEEQSPPPAQPAKGRKRAAPTRGIAARD